MNTYPAKGRFRFRPCGLVGCGLLCTLPWILFSLPLAADGDGDPTDSEMKQETETTHHTSVGDVTLTAASSILVQMTRLASCACQLQSAN